MNKSALALITLCYIVSFSVLTRTFAADIVKTCAAAGIGDQDDMCIWLHPTDPSLSIIIAADKDRSKLFVYNLDGKEISSNDLDHKPGNIDIVYNFRLAGELIDVVAFNTRSINNARFAFFKVDPETRELIDLGAPLTNGWSAELYGFALFHSPNSGEFYAFGCDYRSRIQQYRFFDDGSGNIAMEHKRTLQNGSNRIQTEGMVVDQEAALLYAGNEIEGIYVYHADEDMPTDHIRYIPTKRDTLEADVEGLSIYYAANGEGYLIASSQGEDYFSVFERNGENKFVGRFFIGGVEGTDGIDVLNVPLNSTFRSGIFMCHNDKVEPHPVELVAWDDIVNDIIPPLTIDTTYWNPRERTLTNYDQQKIANREHFLYPNPLPKETRILNLDPGIVSNVGYITFVKLDGSEFFSTKVTPFIKSIQFPHVRPGVYMAILGEEKRNRVRIQKVIVQ